MPPQPRHAARPGDGRGAGAPLGASGQPAQEALDGREGGLRRNLSRHHQHGVVRPVEAALEARQVLAAGGPQLAPRAEHRAAVGVAAEQPLLHRHLERIPGIAVVHGDLFEDHLALAGHVAGIEGQAGDAVGLDGQRLGPAVGGEVEVVGGGVVAGESVVGTAQGLSPPVDLARSEARRALEHHVLEEMGEAAVAGRLVARAGAVAERRGDHRRLVVLEHADGEAVGETRQLPAPGQARTAGQRDRRRCRRRRRGLRQTGTSRPARH